eukprot:50024_1
MCTKKMSLLLQLPTSLQNTIKEFASIHYDSIAIVAIESKQSVFSIPKDIGKIQYNLKDTYCDNQPSLGTFQFTYDLQFHAMDFETEFYAMSDSYYPENMNLLFFTLLQYIFAYKNAAYSTITIPKKFVDRYQITSIKNYPYFTVQNKVYVFRKFKHELFETLNLPQYKCRLVIKNNGNLIYNEEQDTNTLTYDRQCLIFKYDEAICVVFDKPCILFGQNLPLDICFKFKIHETIITDKLSFSLNEFDHIDWQFRMNKYGKSMNCNNNYIDQMDIRLYWCLKTRLSGTKNEHSYALFEANIKKAGFETVNWDDTVLIDWNDDMIEAMSRS